MAFAGRAAHRCAFTRALSTLLRSPAAEQAVHRCAFTQALSALPLYAHISVTRT